MSPCIVIKDEGWWPWELCSKRWGLMALRAVSTTMRTYVLRVITLTRWELYSIWWGLMPWELLL